MNRPDGSRHLGFREGVKISTLRSRLRAPRIPIPMLAFASASLGDFFREPRVPAPTGAAVQFDLYRFDHGTVVPSDFRDWYCGTGYFGTRVLEGEGG